MTISNEIIKMLDYLGAKFGIAIDWTSQNIIPYITQILEKYISWEIATSIAWCIIGGILVIIGVVLMICDHCFYWDGLGVIFGVFGCVIGGGIIVTQIFDIIKCVHFPELQIIEYIQYLIELHS